jgi:hypothetical protein
VAALARWGILDRLEATNCPPIRRYQQARDQEALPIYEFTREFAKIEPPPPENAGRVMAQAAS